VRDLYADQPDLPARDIVDAAAWEASALAGVEEAAGFDDAYARASYQAILALELMTLAVSEHPPRTTEEATTRGMQQVATRLQDVTARFTGASDQTSDAGA
jgi:hypothetical protein